MCWYKLVFKQKQPIHIGKFEWGVVSETEIFIPGWTMWGALVNAYIIKNKAKDKNEIQKIQKDFETITNFFPSFDGETVLEPKYKDGKFYLEDYSEEEFRYKYVKADFKTAVEPISRKAKDEHLYEFEYIIPEFYWIGLIKIENEEIKNFFEGKKLEIFIGGDTKYGYGLLKLEDSKEAKNEDLENWNLSNGGKPNNKTLKNFLEFETNIKFEGELKLIPELDFRQNTPVLTDARYFINVGSTVDSSINISSYKLYKGKFIKNANSP